MKLRLQITTVSGVAFAFEHPGPTLRIGRDPEGELALEGEASQSVSTRHARVELTAAGAFLADLGSTNGTFVNDRRISERTRVQEGDRIQLGYTGPTLKIVELDLSVPEPPAPPELPAVRIPETSAPVGLPSVQVPNTLAPASLPSIRSDNRRLVAAGLLAAGVGVLAGLVIWIWKPGKADQSSVVETNPPIPAIHPDLDPRPPTPEPQPKPEPIKSSPPVPPPPPVDPPSGDAPSVDRKTVGRYVSQVKGPPSILLQRQSDQAAWSRLRRESQVSTASYLMSLPGYRSQVLLDTQVLVTLWGNIPEFSSIPPVLESAAMLNVPAAGFDLDITLDRGRVHLANGKPAGEARIRVRFLRETWDLVLPSRQSEVVLDLWGHYPRNVGFSLEPNRPGPVLALDLYVQGQATLQAEGRSIPLPKLGKLSWSNARPGLAGPEVLDKPPEWWTNRIVPSDDRPLVADAMLALSDYNALLEKLEQEKRLDVVDAVRTSIQESGDRTMRELGVIFLGALDALPPLVEALGDRQHPEVRGSAALALRHWMARSRDQDADLYRVLVGMKAKDKAETVMRLLHLVSEADAQRPASYENLIGLLNHENLDIRQLAFWHLNLLAHQGDAFSYDPAGEPEKRQQAVDQLKKLLAAGKIPPPPRASARSG